MKRFRIVLAAALAAVLLTGCAAKTVPPTVVTAGRTTATAATVTTTTESTVVSAETTTTLTTDATSAVVTTLTTSGSTTKTTALTTAKTTTVKTTVTTTTTTTTTTTKPTPPSRPSGDELIGAWVSYIEIAEMFSGCKTAEQGKKAVDTMLKVMTDNKINTVFFHVRANSDAYYNSKIFKTASAVSKLLAAGFDPLDYLIEAAHKKGIEVHAWINPYRVGKQAAYLVGDVPTLSDAAGRYYYVPTAAETQKLVLDGVREIVNNYAVDGIHYDDYFYPRDTLEENTVYSFEAADYEAYKQGGGTLTVGNWRRAAVDALVAATHTVTAAKGLVFGVSPAVNADDTYKALYADCRKWLAESGYVDYLCPQVYTGFEHGGSPFDKMVDKWMAYPRDKSVKLYVGLALYKIGLKSDTYAGKGKTEWCENDDIMKRSVQYLREKGIKGICFYSYSFFEPTKKLGAEADVAVAEREIKNLKDCL